MSRFFFLNGVKILELLALIIERVFLFKADATYLNIKHQTCCMKNVVALIKEAARGYDKHTSTNFFTVLFLFY